MFDPTPLLADVTDMSIAEVADTFGVTTRTVQRWRTEGTRLPTHMADRCANRRGVHPSAFWPHWGGDAA